MGKCKYCDWLVEALEKHCGKYIEIIAAEVGEPFDSDKINAIWEVITGHIIALPVEHFIVKGTEKNRFITQISEISLCNGHKVAVETERIKEIMLVKSNDYSRLTHEGVDESLYLSCFSDEYKEYMITLAKAGERDNG